MHAEHVQAVIVTQFEFQPCRGPHADHASDDAEQQGVARQQKSGGGGDGDEAGNGARDRAQDRGLAAPEPFAEGPAERGAGRRHLRGEDRHAGAAAGGEGAASIEAEPAHPQNGGAGDREREVERRHVVLPVAKAAAEDDGADEAGDAGVEFHHRAAGEIGHAHDVQPAQRAPDPMGQGRVDQQGPEGEKDNQGGVFHPVHQRPGDDGGRDNGEGHLVE